MTLPPERAVELAKSPKANKWKMIKAKASLFSWSTQLSIYLTALLQSRVLCVKVFDRVFEWS